MQKQRVADQVAERIERLIVDGVLKVGQALPSERRLVAKLGCSRSALREGLRVLRGRGIIDTEHGRGSFVADLDRNADASPLMHLFGSQPRTLYDLLEVRALLEGEAARLAALRGTEADFVLLAGATTRCSPATTKPSRSIPASTPAATMRSTVRSARHRTIQCWCIPCNR